MAIALGCHKWSFPAATCEEAARIIRALGLECMDLGGSADLDPAEIAEHPMEAATRFNRLRSEVGVRFVDCFASFRPRAPSINSPDPEARALSRKLVAGFCRFAAAIGLTGVTLSPGGYWPGEPPAASFDRSAEELRWAVATAREHGLLLRIEPHILSVTWTPELAIAMCEAVSGLTLTIDHSHFVFHGIPYDQIAIMHPYGSHWHARQARPAESQSRFDDGTIPFDRIVADLRARQYDGVICLEYTHQSWMRQDTVDCLTETIRLRDHLRALLDAD